MRLPKYLARIWNPIYGIWNRDFLQWKSQSVPDFKVTANLWKTRGSSAIMLHASLMTSRWFCCGCLLLDDQCISSRESRAREIIMVRYSGRNGRSHSPVRARSYRGRKYVVCLLVCAAVATLSLQMKYFCAQDFPHDENRSSLRTLRNGWVSESSQPFVSSNSWQTGLFIIIEGIECR
jgi:hypothetical protein